MTIRKLSLSLENIKFPFQPKLVKSGALVHYLSTDQAAPTPIYAENVIPTAEGLTSVGFVAYNNALPIDPPQSEYTEADVYPVYAANGNTGYVIVDYGTNTVKLYGPQVGVTEELAIVSSEVAVNVFFSRDRTWIFHKDFGLRYINNDFISVVENITGVVSSNLKGMCSAISYLIAWDDERVYWSDPINFTNFDPTGTTSNAGSSAILAVKGKITMVLPAPKGFVIYTAGNSTRARFTQNIRNPWVFDELKNSSGVAKSNQVTYYESLGTHFVWSSAGFGVVGDTDVQYPFSDLTEFLSSNVNHIINFEELEHHIQLIENYDQNETFRVKMSFLANRYVGISYGPYEGLFSHLLLFDIHLGRWGRVKVDHICAFNFVPPKKDTLDPASDYFDDTLHAATLFFNAAANEFLPRDFDYNYWGKDFALLQPDGDVVQVTPDYKNRPDMEGEGILIYGELRMSHRRYSELSEIELFGHTDLFNEMEVASRAKDTTENSYLKYYYDAPRERYLNRIVGRNHEIMIKGKFNLTGMVVALIEQGVM